MTDEEKEKKSIAIYTYWMECIKRSLKQIPLKKWEKADARLCIKKGSGEESRGNEEKPYDNGYRAQYEGIMSFLDQTAANFEVRPADAFASDTIAKKKAECDDKYLAYVWHEQSCQLAQSKKLDEALRHNNGFTLPGFDKRKWLPNVRYIPSERVLFDADCDGFEDDMGWFGYFEHISLEQLKSTHKDLSGEDIDTIKKSARSVLDEEKQKEVKEPKSKLYTTVRLYHIFARNDAAIRVYDETEEDTLPSKSVLDKFNLFVPKRYLQFVEGLKRPLENDSHWPNELDDKDFPTTHLSFNKITKSLYGFTDFEQMERLDTLCDAVAYDIEKGTYWAGNRKFGGTPEAADLGADKINAMLQDKKTVYIPNLIGANGEEKIKEIQVGHLSPELTAAYKLLREARNEASLLGELLYTRAAEWKDVPATAARIQDINAHQKVNRRLNGPHGYESSIAEDARKILAIAHQWVPKFSVLENKVGDEYTHPSVPWSSAKELLKQDDVQLVQLGADAVVGSELVWFWRHRKKETIKLPLGDVPERFKEYITEEVDNIVTLTIPGTSAEEIRLSTSVRVVPGSTRSITQEQRAAILKNYYSEVFGPMYEALGRQDLAVKFLGKILNLLEGLGDAKDLLPTQKELEGMKSANISI